MTDKMQARMAAFNISTETAAPETIAAFQAFQPSLGGAAAETDIADSITAADTDPAEADTSHPAVPSEPETSASHSLAPAAEDPAQQPNIPPPAETIVALPTAPTASPDESTTIAAPNELYRPRPVADNSHLQNYKALHDRENFKAATIFTGTNGRNLFVHYVEPVLDVRRKIFLSSGEKTKRKKQLFHKSAAQLWATFLQREERSFWNEKAGELRAALKQGTRLSYGQCLEDAGFAHDWFEYRCKAEEGVARYLDIEVPTDSLPQSAPPAPEEEDQQTEQEQERDIDEPALLLPTLPEPFYYEQRMMYPPFAHISFASIRRLEGTQLTARLRQVADLLDDKTRLSKAIKSGGTAKSGKQLFYYYVYPHIWKFLRPTRVDETVATVAQDIWGKMDGGRKEVWRMYKDRAKKRLGEGDVNGLVWLELDGLDEDVLRLHGMVEEVLGALEMG